MYIVTLSYIKDISEVELFIDAHIVYLEKYYALKKFLLSGPKIPRTGGVILVNCNSLDELNSIIKEDPFHMAGVAEYNITEFMVRMASDDLSFLKETQ